MHIYVDESGTHADSEWFIIGMLFVPSFAALYKDLCQVKDMNNYFNKSKKRRAKYKETDLAEFKNKKDLEVAKEWIDAFLLNDCYFRSLVVEWQIWQGRFFGGPFEPEALKKRRAYKKWAEMLLHPEVKLFRNASLYLDKIMIVYGYDILDHLRERFSVGYAGKQPWIKNFQPARSWKDGHQCLQLCDLLVGCIYQTLQPAKNKYKQMTADYLYNRLKTVGVKGRGPKYWQGFDKKTINLHQQKFSEWYWEPSGK